MTTSEECKQGNIEICRTQDGLFVGTAMVLGVTDLPFVSPSTNVLAVEKRITPNATFIKITNAP